MSWAYEDLALLPVCLGLTGLGLVVALVAGSRYGPRAGARALAWALLPMGLYLAGVVKLAWRIGTAVARFGAELAFSPAVWLGAVLLAISLVLFIATGLASRRRAGKGRADTTSSGKTTSVPRGARSARSVGPARTVPPTGISTSGKAGEVNVGEFDDVEEILRRRGIR